MVFDRGPGGYRRIIVAAFGYLITSVLTSSHALADQDPPYLTELPNLRGITIGGPTIEASRSSRGRDDNDQTEQSIPPPLMVKDQSNPPSARESAEDAQQREIADLQAQQSMADSALQLLRLTELQIWIGVAGTLFVLVALIYTARSTRAAIHAAEAAIETYRITAAGIERPYVFFEFCSHNFDAWHAGDEWLDIKFRLINHGKGPVIIKKIRAHAILSWGPYYDPRRDNNRPAMDIDLIDPFPKDISQLAMGAPPFSGIVQLADCDEREPGSFFDISLPPTLFILKPADISKVMQKRLPRGPLRTVQGEMGWEIHRQIHRYTNKDEPARPWLFAQVVYETIFGRLHHTNFCLCIDAFGQAYEYDEAPYTERT